MFDFHDRVVLVTGGASGIGLAIAEAFAAAGATTIVADIAADALDALAKRGFVPLVMNVADETQVENGFASVVDGFGRLDVLVNCAGIVSKKIPLVDVTAEEWRRVMDVDLFGAFLTARAGARIMRDAGRGSIINIASITAKIPRVNMAPYTIAKAGVAQLTKVLALELARDGVRVNAVCPGGTITPLLAESTAGDGRSDLDYRVRGDTGIYRMGIPMGRLAQPEDHTGAVLFLASDAAAHVTGQLLFVDGGESIV
jgi:2,3-dihydro-2,3-dihydroxybenzoate dehydrogenase